MSSPDGSEKSFEDAENDTAVNRADEPAEPTSETAATAAAIGLLIDISESGTNQGGNGTTPNGTSTSPGSRGSRQSNGSKNTSPKSSKPGSAAGSPQVTNTENGQQGDTGSDEGAAMAVGVETSDMDTASLATDRAEAGSEAPRVGWSTRCQSTCSRCWRCINPKVCLGIVTGALIVTAGLAGLCMFMLRPFMELRIKQALVLRPGLGDWMSPSGDITLEVYFFNLTNADMFLAGEQVPILQQIGPYTYRLGVQKTNISWNDNSTVTYKDHYSFTYEKDLSNGTLDDILNTVDIPTITVRHKAGKRMFSVLAKTLLTSDPGLVKKHTIREMLWGYRSLVLYKLNHLEKYMPTFLDPKDTLPQNIPTDFGLFIKESSDLGKFLNVHTGADNFSRLNDIHTWNYETKLPFWATEEANAIRGTDGTIFKPFLNAKSSKLAFFYAELFRSFDLEYKEKRHEDGLKIFRYVVGDDQFFNTSVDPSKPPTSTTATTTLNPTTVTPASTTKSDWFKQLFGKGAPNTSDTIEKSVVEHPSNWSGFCVADCAPNGVYSIESCTQAPLYISLPHFLGADPFYQASVGGLDPQEELHRPIWDVDSVTGVTVYNRRRHQISIKVGAGPAGETYLPIMWMDLDFRLGPATIKKLQTASAAKKASEALTLIALLIVGCLFTFCTFLFIYNSRREQRYRRLGNNGVNEEFSCREFCCGALQA